MDIAITEENVEIEQTTVLPTSQPSNAFVEVEQCEEATKYIQLPDQNRKRGCIFILHLLIVVVAAVIFGVGLDKKTENRLARVGISNPSITAISWI